MTELSDRVSFSEQKLDDVLADSNCHLYVIMDNGHIIGCATLCVFHSPTGTKASIEDVVVSSAYRGQHLGKQLMEHVLEASKTFAPIESPINRFIRSIVNELVDPTAAREASPANLPTTITSAALNKS